MLLLQTCSSFIRPKKLESLDSFFNCQEMFYFQLSQLHHLLHAVYALPDLSEEALQRADYPHQQVCDRAKSAYHFFHRELGEPRFSFIALAAEKMRVITLETAYKVTGYKIKSLIKCRYIKSRICPSRVPYDWLLSKSTYKLDLLWDKWLLYIRFLV